MHAEEGHPPPGIGEALGAGWRAYKANFGPVLIGTLCAMACGMVPMIGGLLAPAGMFNVGLKAVRGIKPEPKDGFIAFSKLADFIVIGLWRISGLILCIVGVYATNPLFLPGTFYILDQNMTWSQAKDKCMAEVKPYLIRWIIFDFVLGLVAFSGVFLCVVGVFLTGPMVNCAMAYAYDKYAKTHPASAAVAAVES